MLIATNGKYDVKSAVQGVKTVAEGQLAQIYKINEEDLDVFFQTMIKPAGNRALKLVDFVEGNDDALFKKTNDKTKLVDVQYETENVIPNDQAILYRDRMEVVIGSDDLWRYTEYRKIQEAITSSLARSQQISEPQACPVGYGFFVAEGDGLKLIRRPNSYFRVGEYSIGQIGYISKDIRKAEAIKVATYTYLAAYFLMVWSCGMDVSKGLPDKLEGNMKFGTTKDGAIDHKTLSNWTIHDYVAMVSILMHGLGASGETDLSRDYSVASIAESLDRMPGFAYSVSNRLQPDSDPNYWANYYLFCLFLGFALSRVKTFALPMEMNKIAGRGNENMGVLLEDANHTEFEGIGGISNLWLPCPRNDMTWKGARIMPLPVIVDMYTEIVDPRERLHHANLLVDVTRFNTVSFSSVQVDRGEIPSNTIDYKSTQSKALMFKPTSDARIMKEEYEWRSVTKYKFPRWGVVKNGLSNKKRLLVSMFGLFMNGDTCLKNGSLVPVGMHIIQPVSVKYAKTKMNEDVVIKSDTDTETNVSKKLLQKPKAAAGMTGESVIESEKPRSNEMKRPPVKPDAPAEPVVVDAIDGDKDDTVQSDSGPTKKVSSGTEIDEGKE
jgi:hypothetical protein